MPDQIFIEVTKTQLQELIRKSIEDCLKEYKIIAERKDDRLLKMDEVCDLLKVSRVTIHKWKKSGKIPFHRISNRVFFKRHEVLQSLERIDLRIRKGKGL